MGIFKSLARRSKKRSERRRSKTSKPIVSRRCRIEAMEPRHMLAADLVLGSVYFEEATGDDTAADTIQVTFEGGAAGTTLEHLTISGDKMGDGISSGDIFFDTADGNLGAFGSVGLTIVSHEGFEIRGFHVVDGGTQIIFDFHGFDAGEKLKFSVDVDEAQFVAGSTIDVNALVEGGEFQRSILTARFFAPRYEDAELTAIYWDAYDANFGAVESATGVTLNLPPDRLGPEHDFSDRTAGAITYASQVPLPTIAGTVFHDVNLNNDQDAPGEVGIANVELALWAWDEATGAYRDTGMRTRTNGNGDYLFEDQGGAGAHTTLVFTDGELTIEALANGDGSNGVRVRVQKLAGVPAAFPEVEFNALDRILTITVSNSSLTSFAHIGQAIEAFGFKLTTTAHDGAYDPALDGEVTRALTGGSARLGPGRYEVREAQPTPYFSVGASAGTIGGVVEGVVLSPDVISSIDLDAGENSIDNDFAEALPATIGGRVHLSTDGDCDFDAPDVLLAGVVVELLDADGAVLQSTTTDVNGRYQFTGLAPGEYQVREHTPATYNGRPVFDGDEHVGTAGGEIAGNDRIRNIKPLGGQNATGYDFCEHVGAAISGWTFHDANNDGRFDTTETGIGGVTVELLDADGNATGITTTTSSDATKLGYYEFTDLAPGVWGVREITPVGYLDGLDAAGTHGGAAVNPGDKITGAELGFAAFGLNYNFGELLPSMIRGRVHLNNDGNCEFDPGDVLLEGVRVDLLDSSGVLLATTRTNANGAYAFGGLAPGEYQIREHTPATYNGAPVFDGEEHVGTAGGEIVANDTIRKIVLRSGTNARDYNFCEHIGAAISGWVYHDADNDGVFDPGENGIGGAVVELLDAGGVATGVTITTSTAPGKVGYYEFTGLAPGTWGVREETPAPYLDGLDRAGTHGGAAVNPGDKITGAVLGFAAVGKNYNFGELLPSTIRGRVHANQDGDCEFEPSAGDFPVENVRIDLLNSRGALLETTYTNAAGEYRFDRLAPGEYQIVEHQPKSRNGLKLYDGDEHVGDAGGAIVANDRIGRVVLTSGTDAAKYDFCEHVGVTLSGWVYHDADNDGVFDPSERGIGGVTLKLLDADGVDTGVRAVTAPGGRYEFSGLDAGVYGVMEVHPTAWLDGIDTPGNRGGAASPSPPGDMILGAVLQFGRSGKDYNFGELLPGAIRGHVHETTLPNCEDDPNARPIAGVKIDLLDSNGRIIATTTTDANGAYAFTGLRPGSYTVREHQPTNFFNGNSHVGTGGGSRLDRNTLADITIHSADNLVDYDFCELPASSISGYVFQDGEPIIAIDDPPEDVSAIRNGERTPDDKPIAGVVLELRHGRTGDPIFGYQALPGVYAFDGPIRTVTDKNGYYEFTGLPGGTYAVVEIHPDGYIDGHDTPGTINGQSVGYAINPRVIQTEAGPALGPSQATIDQFRERFGNEAIINIALPSGTHSIENNFSEVVTQKPFIPPETPDPPRPIAFAPPTIPFQPTFLAPQTIIERTLPHTRSAYRGMGNTWHLSVIDAGFPRSVHEGQTVGHLAGLHFDARAWRGAEMTYSTWTIAGVDGVAQAASERIVFGNPNGVPVVGDWDGDGVSEIGVFMNGEWFLDVNGNGVWDQEDLWAKLGAEGDLPVTGDWDGDGKTDIGIFGPTWPGDRRAIDHEPGLPDPENNERGEKKNVPPDEDEATHGKRTMKYKADGRLRADVIDHVFHYGKHGDRPVTGDWNGDGIETIGVFRGGAWYVDANGDGRYNPADEKFQFGRGDEIPIVGDWNGDGIDDLGVFRNGRWIIDSDGDRRLTAHDRVFELGRAGDLPAVGDWDGDGVDEPAVYHPNGEQILLGKKAQ